MVFLGLEQPVAYGREQVFDPTTAQMVLNANRDYINAVYNDYQQARQDMKDFAKEYGDFLSPIAKDMEWYEKNVTGDVRNFINNLYAQGIDPLRSQEGRSLVARKLASMPIGTIQMLRQSAKDREEYDKTVAQMKANGTYNEDFERWRFAREHNGLSPEEWSTVNNGLWGTRSAVVYQDLNAATKHWYDGMEKGLLYEDPEGYEWWGNSVDDVRKVAQSHLPDLTSEYWQYQKDLARRQAGPNATPEQIQQQFENNLVSAAAEVYTRPERRESGERKRRREYYYDNMLDAVKTARDRDTKLIEDGADTDGDGQLSKAERKAYADAKKEATNNNGKGNKSGEGWDVIGDAVKTGFAQTTGQDPVLSDLSTIGSNIAAPAVKWGNSWFNTHKSYDEKQNTNDFYNHYTSSSATINPKAFDEYLEGRERVNGVASGAVATEDDLKHLVSREYMTERTLGNRTRKYKGDKPSAQQQLQKKINDNKGAGIIIAYEDGRTYSAPFRDATARVYTTVHLYVNNGGQKGQDLGTAEFEIHRSKPQKVRKEGTIIHYPKTWDLTLDPNFLSFETGRVMSERGTMGTAAKDASEEIRLSSHRR